MYYELGFNISTNTFKKGELILSLTGIGDNGSKISDITSKSIVGHDRFFRIGTGHFSQSDGDTHIYELKIFFKDTGKNQNYNQNAVFNAQINTIESHSDLVTFKQLQDATVNETACKEYFSEYSSYFSEEDFTTICTGGTINFMGNNISVVSYFGNEYESLIENGVISDPIFSETETPKIGTNFTEGIYNYSYNDNGWVVSLADPSSTAPITTAPRVSINGEKITTLASLFYESAATSIDLSTFDTSNITNMASMFRASHATSLDLSYLDTSNVTNMTYMFSSSYATSLDLSYLDTSNVTNMTYMFAHCNASILDISSFNTSNIPSKGGVNRMFADSPNLVTIYASNNFRLVPEVSGDDYVFENSTAIVGGSGTTYDSNRISRNYAHIDGGVSNPGYFTLKT